MLKSNLNSLMTGSFRSITRKHFMHDVILIDTERNIFRRRRTTRRISIRMITTKTTPRTQTIKILRRRNTIIRRDNNKRNKTHDNNTDKQIHCSTNETINIILKSIMRTTQRLIIKTLAVQTNKACS